MAADDRQAMRHAKGMRQRRKGLGEAQAVFDELSV